MTSLETCLLLDKNPEKILRNAVHTWLRLSLSTVQHSVCKSNEMRHDIVMKTRRSVILRNPCVVFSAAYSHRHANLAAYTRRLPPPRNTTLFAQNIQRHTENSRYNVMSLSLQSRHQQRGTAPLIPNLGTRWMWVISFTPRPFYPVGKIPGTR
jgi:hypothetical protein